MRTANRTLGLLVCLCALAAAERGLGQNWPQWRGPNRDGQATGFVAPETWPAELTQKWDTPVGDGVATPALVGEKLYVFAREEGDEVLRCLNAANGDEIWQDSYSAQGATGPASGFSGPRASPTVADGKVVTLGVRGVVSCHDAETGELLWRKDDFPGEWPRFFTSSSPIVVDDLAIVQLGGNEDGAVVAYNLEGGEEAWRWSGDGAAYASPVLATVDGLRILIAETDERIVGLSIADGKLLWEMPYVVVGRGYNAATPIVHAGTVLYSGSNRGVKAMRLSQQDDAVAGRELWSNDDNSVQYNSPILKDGLVYGLSNRDVLFCIDAESGKTSWTAPVGVAASSESPRAEQDAQQDGAGRRRGRRGGRGRGRGGYGSIVDAGSVLFALTPTGQLTVFEPGGEEFKQLASYKVANEGTYAYPVLSGSRLFVKDDDSVALWMIE